MRIWAEINLDNLKENLRLISNGLDRKEILGVIKANAYGHGAVEIAKELSEIGVKFFGVACIEEAEDILASGIECEILILGCTPKEDWEKAVSLGVQLTLASFEEIKYIEKMGIYPKVHIKVDTGMGRIGFTPKEAKNIIDYIHRNGSVELKGVFSHFSTADEDIEYSYKQLNKFEALMKEYPEIEYTHISNSAGILNISEKCNLVRAGIILYGVQSFDSKIKIDIKPVMTLKSKILFLKEIETEQDISYGRKYRAKKGEKIATISAGYGDGVNRKLSNCGEVYISGEKCQIIGTICMDQLMVKIPSYLKGVKVGDEVELFGEKISIDRVAILSETIPYEILTGITSRVGRIYIKGGKVIEERTLLGRRSLI